MIRFSSELRGGGEESGEESSVGSEADLSTEEGVEHRARQYQRILQATEDELDVFVFVRNACPTRRRVG